MNLNDIFAASIVGKWVEFKSEKLTFPLTKGICAAVIKVDDSWNFQVGHHWEPIENIYFICNP